MGLHIQAGKNSIAALSIGDVVMSGGNNHIVTGNLEIVSDGSLPERVKIVVKNGKLSINGQVIDL